MAKQKKGLKTIREIIDSTNSVKGYEASSLSRKPMGSIYLYNKRIKAKPNHSIVEISMMISGVTDFIRTKNGKRPVAAHKVLMAIHGVEQEAFTPAQLVKRIREENNKYADESVYPDADLITLALQEKEILPNRTVLETGKETYVALSKNISPDCFMKVWCSCSSYYWTFAWYNVDNNIDIRGERGRPERYTYASGSKDAKRGGKQLSPRMAPLNNPNKAFGMCKHLTLLLGILMDEGVVEHANKGKDDPGNSFRMNIDRFTSVERLSPEAYDELAKKWKNDQKRKTTQRRQYIYGPKYKRTKNFAQKNNPNIVHKKFNWKKGK